MEVRNTKDIEPFITKDGSKIKEIFHPSNSQVKNMSDAEARVEPGKTTKFHYHQNSEEIYVILEGEGVMEIEEEKRRVKKGDHVLIPPGKRHRIKNVGKEALIFLCFSTPPYSHDDTVLLEDED